MEVAIEATPSWHRLYDRLEDDGLKVKLSHPLKTKAIAYAKVNATQNRMLCARLRVLSLPAYLFYNNVVEVNHLVAGAGNTGCFVLSAAYGTMNWAVVKQTMFSIMRI